MKTMIIDTDVGFDPDDVFALLLAFNSPEVEIALLTTADEINTQRARFLQTILKTCHKDNIPVVCGARLQNDYFIAEELSEKMDTEFDDDYIGRMKKVIDENDDVTYLGIGGFTNLANFYKVYPEYRDEFDVFMMGGAMNYNRGTDWVEHNVKVDVSSAKFIIENPPKNLSLVMAQTTFQQEYEVGEQHFIFQKLKQSKHPVHAMLVKHIELFHKSVSSWPKMHDPLTLATAIGKDFVTLHKSIVSMDQHGTMHEDPNGQEMYWSDAQSKKQELMKFLESRLFA